MGCRDYRRGGSVRQRELVAKRLLEALLYRGIFLRQKPGHDPGQRVALEGLKDSTVLVTSRREVLQPVEQLGLHMLGPVLADVASEVNRDQGGTADSAGRPSHPFANEGDDERPPAGRHGRQRLLAQPQRTPVA
jgi:hypothetical protein